MSNSKIISAVIKPNHNYTNIQQIDFYSINGYETSVMHENVQSVNVTGDRIIIISESSANHIRQMYMYDANTRQYIGVQCC